MGLTDDELDAVGREIHGMFHAGASRADALERLKTRLSRGRYDEIPRLLRPVFHRAVKRCLAGLWTTQACGPDHEHVICDEPHPV